jgi:hypothetical protein
MGNFGMVQGFEGGNQHNIQGRNMVEYWGFQPNEICDI